MQSIPNPDNSFYELYHKGTQLLASTHMKLMSRFINLLFQPQKSKYIDRVPYCFFLLKAIIYQAYSIVDLFTCFIDFLKILLNILMSFCWVYFGGPMQDRGFKRWCFKHPPGKSASQKFDPKLNALPLYHKNMAVMLDQTLLFYFNMNLRFTFWKYKFHVLYNYVRNILTYIMHYFCFQCMCTCMVFFHTCLLAFIYLYIGSCSYLLTTPGHLGGVKPLINNIL